jgi:hypothetical protein
MFQVFQHAPGFQVRPEVQCGIRKCLPDSDDLQDFSLVCVQQEIEGSVSHSAPLAPILVELSDLQEDPAPVQLRHDAKPEQDVHQREQQRPVVGARP